ncbi:hypothetical protein SG34_018395 [Thalassomonas viridans]|uniref:Uncharacterized protein n=1 Tax=Thalassomonas viridans TaxID=137584 RepID=A0AAF0C7H8_9GAMM|nr:hypothetical protein [Thalassomonas viridans]WDE03361.1 hypothetical protein SG34_018395 [Thalassomonas viridans]
MESYLWLLPLIFSVAVFGQEKAQVRAQKAAQQVNEMSQGMQHTLPMSATADTMPGHEGMMDHSHEPVAIPANLPVPKLEVALYKDEKSGFNLHIELADFELEAPEFASEKPLGYVQGHAHLFINGQKIQRVYGQYLHLPGTLFKPGINQVMVTLNNHDHKIWSRDKKQVVASVFIDAGKEPFIKHSFSSSPLLSGAG